MTIKQLQLEYHGVVVSKKNSKIIRKNRRTGASFITSNNVAKRNEADMIYQFKNQIRGAIKVEDFAPCTVEINLYEPDQKRRDLDNQATSILDALVKAGVIIDDSIETLRGITVRLKGICKSDPRAEVIITREEEAVLCLS